MPAISSSSRALHRLIYASRVSVPASEIEYEVAAIIRASIRNNRERAITGLLLIHDGWFVQALEGPSQAVLETYGRIVEDRRHADAKVLTAEPATTREFGDWNMCARHMTPADDAILDALAQRQAFAPAGLSGPAALRLLEAVRGIQDRTVVAALG